MIASMNRIIVFVGVVEQCAEFYRNRFELRPIESTHSPKEWPTVNRPHPPIEALTKISDSPGHDA